MSVPHIRLYRLGTAAALVAAPPLFLVDNLLHPEELTRGNELEQVAIIAQEYTRWQVAHAVGFVAILVGTETAIVSNAYFIAGAAVFLAGGIAVAAAIARMTDEQFAQGSA